MLQLFHLILLLVSWLESAAGQAGVPPPGSEYNDVNRDGSYRFGFQTGDSGAHYQAAVANQKNQVAGRFGSWDPAQRRVVDTEYTAGKRGFRARGPNIARKMDLSQNKIPYNPPVSPNSPNYNPTYDGYHDPNEDPSYSFTFRTPTYSKQETSDSRGRVNGAYYYFDDIGERHDVTYEAGSKIGFNVNTPFPDSKVFNGLFYKGASKPGGKPRGKTSIQQRRDGSYRFVASGPDQRRTEISDSSRNVRGSYTYLDDKGQQRTVEYIAGPNIGYRIVKKGIGPNFPAPPPFIPPPNFTDLPDRIVPTSPPNSGTSAGGGPFGGGDSNLSSGENTEDNNVGGDYNENSDFPPFPSDGSGENTEEDSSVGGGSFPDISTGRPGTGRPGQARPNNGRPGTGRPGSGGAGSSRPVLGGSSSGRPSSTFRPGSGRPGTVRPGTGRPTTPRPGFSGSTGDSSENSGEFGSEDNRFPRPGGNSEENSGKGDGIFGGNSGPGSSGETGAGEDGLFRPGGGKFPGGGSESGESGYPGSGEFPNWPTTGRPSTTTPPLFNPSFPNEGKYPSQFPQSSRPITTTTIITSSTTEAPYPGYFSGKPKPGSPPFPYPNNCCGSPTSTARPDIPGSAFPEDDPNRPHHPPPHGQTDDFLTTPFENLPPKNYDGFYKPSHGSSSRPNYYYPSQQGDSTFLSSNKNYFSFPTGVAVRAHIQSLDILPFGSRIPPPGLALEQGVSNSG